MRFRNLMVVVCIGAAGVARGEPATNDMVLRTLQEELARSTNGLANAAMEPMYYLGYEVHDVRNTRISATLGTLRAERESHQRIVTVDLRIGNRAFDNTHQLKGRSSGWQGASSHAVEIVREDDAAALRADLWLVTDGAYKSALDQYAKVTLNKTITAEEEDTSDDLSVEKPQRSYHTADLPAVDKAALQERVTRLSRICKDYPFILGSEVGCRAECVNRYIVTSEGTEVASGRGNVMLMFSMTGRTEDGMDLMRYRTYFADTIDKLPAEAAIAADIKKAAGELDALLKAPLVEPYNGPAIFQARAAAVYFHEILGHRLEGHRQKLEREGQTFAKKLGTPITAPFLTIYDDATLDRSGNGTFLNGHYDYDDEGMPVRRVSLVEAGNLKGFLMSRSPIKNFPVSNGHGRRGPGASVVARMGNLIVESTQRVPYAKLREQLIEQIKKQNKPYGLVFEDISGGFTMTGRGAGQSFKVLPLLVYRVYSDGRPDEVVRGVDIVGTPLTSFTKIIAAGDDDDVFNGTCGAESGNVPVSAISPSILFSEVEVEKAQKSSEKLPILPPPFHDSGEKQ